MGLFATQINTLLALEAWNYNAPTPAAPTNLRQTATTGSTITLAWDAAAGTYTLQRAPVTNGTPGTFATVTPGPGTAKFYQDGPLTFNTTYAYRVKVNVNGVDSPYSNVVQATTAAGTTPTTITPATADYGQNGGLSSASTQPGRNSTLSGSRAALSTLYYSTTDPQPTISVQTGMHDFGTGYVAVFNGLNLVGTYAPSQDGVAQTFQLPALSGSAPYALTVVGGNQQRSYEQGDIRGTELVSITARAGYAISKVAPVKKSELIIWFGDSISGGSGSSLPQNKSAAALLRQMGVDVTLYGYGSAQAYVMMDPANYPAVQAFVQAAQTGYAAVRFVFTPGTNDYHGGVNGSGNVAPSVLASRYADFVAYVQSLNTSASTTVITPLRRTDTEAANNLGFTMPQYRAAILAAIPTAIDGANVVSVNNISGDGVHPTDAGHAELAAVIAGQTKTFTEWGSNLHGGNDGSNTGVWTGDGTAQPVRPFDAQGTDKKGCRGAFTYVYEILDAPGTADTNGKVFDLLFGFVNATSAPRTPHDAYDVLHPGAYKNGANGDRRLFVDNVQDTSGFVANGYAKGDVFTFKCTVDSVAQTKSLTILRNNVTIAGQLPLVLAYNDLYAPSITANDALGNRIRGYWTSGTLEPSGAA